MKPQSEPRPGYPPGPERLPATRLSQRSLTVAALPGVWCTPGFSRLACAYVNRLTLLSHTRQELPASVTIVDEVYEERRIGEEVRHQFRCVSPFVGSSSRRMDSTHCAAPSFSSGCFSRSQPSGFPRRNCSSRMCALCGVRRSRRGSRRTRLCSPAARSADQNHAGQRPAHEQPGRWLRNPLTDVELRNQT